MSRVFDESDFMPTSGGARTFDESDFAAPPPPPTRPAPKPDSIEQFGTNHPIMREGILGAAEGLGIDLQNPLTTIPNMIGGAYRTLKNVASGAIERPNEGIGGSLLRNVGGPLVKGLASDVGGIGSDIASMEPERMAHGAGKAAGMVGPLLIGSGKPTGLSRGAAGALDRSAVKSMEGIFQATGANKAKIAQISPELVERGFGAMTQPGAARKLEANTLRAGEALEQGYARQPVKQIDTQQIVDAIEKSKHDSGAVIQGANGPVIVEPTIAKAADDLKAIVQEFGPQVGSDSLVKLRQRWDKTVAQSKGFVQPDIAQSAAVKRDAVSAIRDVMNSEFPDIQKLNAEYSFWKKASDVMDATLLRKSGQAPPIGQRAARGIGAIVGGTHGGLPGAFAGAEIAAAATAAMRSTWWKSASAASKSRLANLMMSGNSRAVNVAIAAMSREANQ